MERVPQIDKQCIVAGLGHVHAVQRIGHGQRLAVKTAMSQQALHQFGHGVLQGASLRLDRNRRAGFHQSDQSRRFDGSQPRRQRGQRFAGLGVAGLRAGWGVRATAGLGCGGLRGLEFRQAVLILRQQLVEHDQPAVHLRPVDRQMRPVAMDQGHGVLRAAIHGPCPGALGTGLDAGQALAQPVGVAARITGPVAFGEHNGVHVGPRGIHETAGPREVVAARDRVGGLAPASGLGWGQGVHRAFVWFRRTVCPALEPGVPEKC